MKATWLPSFRATNPTTGTYIKHNKTFDYAGAKYKPPQISEGNTCTGCTVASLVVMRLMLMHINKQTKTHRLIHF